ncbi:hypothetical protein KIPB_000654 [Kipferlia bialata]|uniref:Uncharacterized protein n=1 Tax=Kipferlia bialata TaxID=797122 RepID=A0A9K3CNX6_9EUKA|nr:hypothetical protein KIPB_000654 [Kipferlia bialata]|eukprot:g654.t1
MKLPPPSKSWGEYQRTRQKVMDDHQRLQLIIHTQGEDLTEADRETAWLLSDSMDARVAALLRDYKILTRADKEMSRENPQPEKDAEFRERLKQKEIARAKKVAEEREREVLERRRKRRALLAAAAVKREVLSTKAKLLEPHVMNTSTHSFSIRCVAKREGRGDSLCQIK